MVKIRILLILLISLCLNCASSPEISTTTPYVYDSVTFEICAIGSASLPDPDSLKFLASKLNEHKICQLSAISFLSHNTSDPLSFPVWSTPALNTVEIRNRKIRDPNPKDKNIFIFVMYVSGDYVSPTLTNLSGLQWGTTIAIFEDRMSDIYEGSTLLHEFGHSMGLTRERTESPANPDRPRHCNDSSCVMYWIITRRDADFDSECIKEIRAML